MGLNDIEFPRSVLIELYRTPLIIDEKINPPLIQDLNKSGDVQTISREKTSHKIQLPSLGENEKNILVIVSDPEHKLISDANLDFLTGILKACQLGMKDVLLLNHSVSGAQYPDLKKQFHPRFLLMFGLTPDQLGIPMRFPEFQVTSYTGIQFLAAPPLDQIKENRELKSNLWNSLRKIFNIG